MAAMNLRSVDLNLLLVFEAILREGSVAAPPNACISASRPRATR
jgi:hypothetical protein